MEESSEEEAAGEVEAEAPEGEDAELSEDEDAEGEREHVSPLTWKTMNRSPAGWVLSGGRGRYGQVAFAARACRLVHVSG